MESFLKEAIRSMKTSGTVKPSSKYLIDNCLKGLNFEHAKNIVEFGSGDGCITQEIANRMNPHSKLFSFEFNDKFFAHCEKKFQQQANILMQHSSALDFDAVLVKANVHEVDFIISSLPLTLFDEEHVDILLKKAKTYLKENGHFVQYQYSLGQYFKLKKIFQDVNVNFTFRNVPPAFVYRCKK